MYIPPLKACLFTLPENDPQTCVYGDLTRTCPAGSSTCANPPCPWNDMFANLVASFIKNTSI